MRKPYIAGNWKMNLTPSEAAKLATELAAALKGSDRKVMVAPSFVSIPAVVNAVKGSNIIVAAQNVNDHKSGAFTGEVSASQLADLGVKDVILGHSERRHIYGESNELINSKVLFALENGFDVVLCVGETLDERESGNLEKVLGDQVTIDSYNFIPCCISSSAGTELADFVPNANTLNNYQPTPYAQGGSAWNRTLSMLNGTYEGANYNTDYSNVLTAMNNG